MTKITPYFDYTLDSISYEGIKYQKDSLKSSSLGLILSSEQRELCEKDIDYKPFKKVECYSMAKNSNYIHCFVIGYCNNSQVRIFNFSREYQVLNYMRCITYFSTQER